MRWQSGYTPSRVDAFRKHREQSRARKWEIPTFAFPKSYLSFLEWSNGGTFTKGGREFGFFPVDDARCGVRAMMLAYHIPEYMNQAVPFAFDGAGTFYLFDMREPPLDDEFPIVMAHAGSLGWDEDDYETIAESFVAALEYEQRRTKP